MIQITIDKDSLEAAGHARYAQRGKDIVCAGVSALIDAFSLSAENDIVTKERIGYKWVRIVNDTPETRAKFQMLIDGLKAISQEYPKHVDVYEQRYLDF